MIKLISTDFDGTLFAEFESPPVPARLQGLIARLQQQGTRWVINTGRDMSSLMETLGRASLEIQPDYLVLVEREIHCHSHSQYLGLEDWNSECERKHEQLFARVRRDLPSIIEWITERYDAYVYEDSFSPFCLIARSPDDAEAIQTYLDAYCAEVPGLAVMRNDVYARFCHADYHKGSALKEISRRLQISPHEVFAIGDHLNDLPMLSPEFAGYLAAPGNAIDPVKTQVRRHGGYVSQLAQGHGVADALEWCLNGKR